MFRACSMAHGATPSDNFLDRLRDLPLVKDGVGKVEAMYSGTKQYNFLLRITLEAAESGVGIFATTTKPLLNAFQKPLGSINDLACKQLEKIEKNYPIIAQPTDEVYKQTKATVQPLANRLKPITDRVSCVTKCGMSKITSTKDYTTGKVGAVSEYGMNKVNVVKSYAMATVSNLSTAATGQASVLMETKMFLYVLSQVEKFIESSQLAKNDEAQGSEFCQGGNVGDVPSNAPIYRLWRVMAVVRYAVLDQSTRRLECLRCGSSKALSKINPTNLMDWASWKDSVYCYYYVKKDRIVNLWNAVNNPNYVIGENETELSTYEAGLVTCGRYLKMKAGSGLMFVDQNLSSVLASVDNKVPLCMRHFMAGPIKYMVVKKHYQSRKLASYDEMIRGEPEPCTSSDDSNDEKKSEEDIYHSPAKHHPDEHHH